MIDPTLLAEMDTAMQTYQHWENEAAKLVPMNKACLFAVLASVNITRVIVFFDGAGDSGQIEEIQVFIGNELAALPGAEVETFDLPYGAVQPVRRQQAVELVLETLVYDLLREAHDGWENADGAFGEFVFDVTAGTIELEFNERVTSSERYDHCW